MNEREELSPGLVEIDLGQQIIFDGNNFVPIDQIDSGRLDTLLAEGFSITTMGERLEHAQPLDLSQFETPERGTVEQAVGIAKEIGRAGLGRILSWTQRGDR